MDYIKIKISVIWDLPANYNYLPTVSMELLSAKTAPMVDSTMSARTFGALIIPLECNG